MTLYKFYRVVVFCFTLLNVIGLTQTYNSKDFWIFLSFSTLMLIPTYYALYLFKKQLNESEKND